MYSVTLRRDETASWDGERFVDRKGRYEGMVYECEFKALAAAIVKLGLFSLPDEYPVEGTDMPSTITTVRWAGGEKVVDNYGGQGPRSLWMIETLIDGVAAGVRWRDEGSPPIDEFA